MKFPWTHAGIMLPAMSPPSRGAWIEIPHPCCSLWAATSPPSRGAWIEMQFTAATTAEERKSPPLAGGVD